MSQNQEIEKMRAGEQLDTLVGETFGFRQEWSHRLCCLYWREYSVKIQDAWHVVLAMKVRGYRFHLLDEQYGDDLPRWAAKFVKSGSSRFESAVAYTPELAICRAGLLALLPESAARPTKEEGGPRCQ